MSEEQGQEQELEVTSGDKKIKLRGSDLLTAVIGMVMCSGLALFGYALWQHKDEDKEHKAAVVAAIKDMAQAQKQAVVTQRAMNCLLSLAQDKREAAFTNDNSLCNRLAREQ